jgi:HK97 family phage portal protein
MTVDLDPTYSRGLPVVMPSPWDGWPADWGVPNWDFGSRFNELIDVAWMCLDINTRILSTMPVYRTTSGRVSPPMTWMQNPDPAIYASWPEFSKQLFWDYLLGESFVWSMAEFTDGYPMKFRVLPPWMVKIEMREGTRHYTLPSGRDITSEILHIRYKSTTDTAHGVGPLEAAGARMLTAGILAKYVRDTVAQGGVYAQTLETDQELTPEDAQDLLQQWVTSRAQNLGYPPVLDNNIKLVDHKVVSPKDMAMLEISQFTESRIALLLGVPPFLAGLPTGDSMIYSNVQSLFDYHDRSALRPYATTVMSALSNWSLPRGQAAELNRDEYTRPDFAARADAWVKLVGAGIVTVDEARLAERLTSKISTQALTGATLNGSPQEVPSGV